ncbi:hypothetical protein GLYMA_15G029500v4 [Glycine max]|uniref:B box-type domain-containing protein n=2 Tax=Glycine max TaxID=3847 RepID=A0A0R0FVE5_SOYBN|nr:hypothetical protein JHK85_041898 [Glycine max]KAH1145262.1 hypothetical protein GYH30_041171 [Glycine max]KRH10122.1 hypothetical protein GLYMA_15G029500v4 [Glycine max]
MWFSSFLSPFLMRHSKVRPNAPSDDQSSQLTHNPQLDHGGWSRRGREFCEARRAFLNSYHLSLERKNNVSFKEKLKKSVKEVNEAAMGVVLGMRRGVSKRRVGIKVFRVKMSSHSMVLVTLRCFIPWLNKMKKLLAKRRPSFWCCRRKRRINMKIQCDVCERAPATVICCADEAALCAKCDVEVHAANKLASKHQRLLLQCLSSKLPTCDICQDKPAFIFCVEDRALFCQDCDEPIHSAGSLSANHQRFLATGIRVASSSNCTKDNEKSHSEPPNRSAQQVSAKIPPQQVPSFTSSWAVDDLLELTGFESPEKKESLQFGELEWLTDVGIFGEQFAQEALAAAEVPQLPETHNSSSVASYKTSKSYMSHKKPRIEVLNDDDDDEYFTVPDLG